MWRLLCKKQIPVLKHIVIEAGINQITGKVFKMCAGERKADEIKAGEKSDDKRQVCTQVIQKR